MDQSTAPLPHPLELTTAERTAIRVWWVVCLTVSALVVLLVRFVPPPALVTTVSTQHRAQLPLAEIPVTNRAVDTPVATVSAKALVVFDRPSETILLRKNETELLPPASTVKMATALAARSLYSEDAVLSVPATFSAQGTVVGLVPGQRYAVPALLQGLLMSSGNDVAQLLAIDFEGGPDLFIEYLNRFTTQLGLRGTITNPSGLDDTTQRLSTLDLVLLADELLRDEFLATIVASQSAVITSEDQLVAHQLTNTNELLGQEGVTGVKTGTTEGAGQVLVTRFQPSVGRDLLIVVMGSRDRYQDTQTLLNWIQSEVDWVVVPEL